MPDAQHTDSDQQKISKKKKKILDPGMKRIFAFGIVALAVLLIFTFAQASGRVPFFTENFLSLLVLVAIVVQAYIYGGQWQVMRRQWIAMRRGLRHTRSIMDQNERMISAMEAQRNETEVQAVAALEAVEMAQGQLKAMNAQRKLLERDIESAEKSATYAQRAYVTAKIRDIGEKDDTLQFRLRIENSGNTPANDVVVVYSYGLRDKPPHDKAHDSDVVVYDLGFTETERLGLIAPNGSYHVISTPEIECFQKGPTEDYEGFISGQLTYYCWGRIIYEDIFNEKRRTDFCFFQSMDHMNGYPCQYGNKAI